jgi:hypothetical protein
MKQVCKDGVTLEWCPLDNVSGDTKPHWSSVEKIGTAIGLRITNPNWTDKAIAAKAGISTRTLQRSLLYQRIKDTMAELAKSNIRHGTKYEGDIETADDDETWDSED